MTTFEILAAADPAGGAETSQILIATTGAVIATAILLFLGQGHRSGRVTVLEKASVLSERATGLPGWAALPSGLNVTSLLTALFGMYWDISLHIDVGRDAGPLANPAHYFILAGLFGIFASGYLAMVLPKERPSASAIRIGEGWYAPLGGVLICACGAFSLLGFPLDDFWHKLFGQDVTLWGPTHLMLIGGAAMALVGQAVLLVEAARSNEEHQRREMRWAYLFRRVALGGGLLIGLSTFQAEFDFGVPQFRFIFEPVMIMVAAGVALVSVRMWLGPGAAIGAVAFFLLVRGVIALLVGPVLGESTPYLPLYVVEAAIVELVALRIGRERPIAFGATCGALIGTVGLASEWGWSHLVMPIPWPSELLPEGALFGLAAALAASLVGAWMGARLGPLPEPRVPVPSAPPVGGRALRNLAVAGAVVLFAILGYGLNKPAPENTRVSVALEEVRGGADRTVAADVRFQPRDAAEDAEWVTVTAWQGGGFLVNRLERIGEGHYRTTEPIPVHSEWKSLIRLHRGNVLGAAPIFLPKDTAIPAPEIPAKASFTREMVADHELLQRESKSSGGALPLIAYLTVFVIAFALLILLAWALHRLSRAAPPHTQEGTPGDAPGDDRSPDPGRRRPSTPLPA